MENEQNKFVFKISTRYRPEKRPIIMERTATGWKTIFMSSFEDKKDCRMLLNELRSGADLDIPPYIDMLFESVWKEAEDGADHSKIQSSLEALFDKIEQYRPPKKKR